MKMLVGGSVANPGEAVVHGAVVVDDDGTIAEIGFTGPIPNGVETIDVTGHTLLPGLIDCHVHLYGVRTTDQRSEAMVDDGLRAARGSGDALRILKSGFTTVRDVGSHTAIAVRRAIEEGSIEGPTILASGRFLSRTAGGDDPTYLPFELAAAGYGRVGVRIADGPDQVRAAVRLLVRDGADLIKTSGTGVMVAAASDPSRVEWTDEELGAMIDEAHRLGKRVAVHAHSPAGIVQAVELGADTIEHGTFGDRESSRRLANSSAILVPTVSWFNLLLEQGPNDAHGDLVDRAREWRERQVESLNLAVDEGVRVALGSDATGDALSPHGHGHRELEFMVSYGLDPSLVLQSATSVAAEALGLDSVGVLQPGKRADIIAVRQDPSNDITALRSLELVMKNGELVRP